MALEVRSLDPADPVLDDLVKRSHQTSLYVLPEWRKAFPPARILGAFQGETLTAAAFVEGAGETPFVAYRGLLLTRREQVPVINALLGAIEHLPSPVLTNAPSMVDVRPFLWRWPPALWRSDIRYTVFLYPDSRPFVELVPVDPQPGRGEPCPIPWVDEVTEARYHEILSFPSTKVYEGGGATIVVGTDAQDRGYYIAGWGPGLPALTRSVASQFPSFDLGGTNSPASAHHKRLFGGQLRTIYRLFL